MWWQMSPSCGLHLDAHWPISEHGYYVVVVFESVRRHNTTSRVRTASVEQQLKQQQQT